MRRIIISCRIVVASTLGHRTIRMKHDIIRILVLYSPPCRYEFFTRGFRYMQAIVANINGYQCARGVPYDTMYRV
ncbi:hypothetical protein PUN28_002305 [Cardiocondyla obscurior]|uniref:Uncharacterized protein n=1 Tax=Cardiocondyla obscurior TaxID=286306 RepID=A0AAW2GTF0_9HYME